MTLPSDSLSVPTCLEHSVSIIYRCLDKNEIWSMVKNPFLYQEAEYVRAHIAHEGLLLLKSTR